MGVQVERYTRATPRWPQAWLVLAPHGQLPLPERQDALGAEKVPPAGGGAEQAAPGSLGPAALVLLPQVHQTLVWTPRRFVTFVETAASSNQCSAQNSAQRSSVAPLLAMMAPLRDAAGLKPSPASNANAPCSSAAAPSGQTLREPQSSGPWQKAAPTAPPPATLLPRRSPSP